jgi:transcriptional regulator with XRE-family HTH domain
MDAGELGKIQKTLKDQMRKKNFAYTDLSKLLEVSEATIKRRLNGEDISIEQLREMASVMDIGFYELIELSKQQDNQVHTFTIEQENFLAKAMAS